MQTPQEQPKRVLVLSGGGWRGAYQAGVPEYLERVGWPSSRLTTISWWGR